jgi:Family of unknown function (DUF5898)
MTTGMSDNTGEKRLFSEVDEDVEGNDDAVTNFLQQHMQGVDPGLIQKLKNVALEEATEKMGHKNNAKKLRRAEEEARQAREKAHQAEERVRQAEEGKRQAEEGKRQAEEGKRQAEEGKLQAEEGKRQAEESLKKTDMITAHAFCQMPQWHVNTSSSTACLHDVAGAAFKDVHDHYVDLPREFWDQPVYKRNERDELKASNEATVEDMILADLKSTLRALILSGLLPADGMLSFCRQRPTMGLYVDIGVIHGPNEFLCGTVEVKKHDVKHREQIMEAGGPGAGQAFDQLTSCQIGMLGDSYALLSTRNNTRLVSTGDFSVDVKEIRERLGKLHNSGGNKTENESSTNESPEHCMLASRKGAAPAVPNNSRRSMWSCPLVQVGISTQGAAARYKDNREYITTLAKFILLAEQAALRGPRDVTESPLHGPVRTFNVESGTCAHGTLVLEQGINFCRTPSERHKIFTAWSQLGFGQSACCCLATVGSKAPVKATQSRRRPAKQKKSSDLEAVACVLKIYHDRSDKQFELAKQEAQRWHALYGKKEWTFIKAYYEGTKAYLILVLPFLHVPTALERQKLLNAGCGGKEESPLWKGLKRFADKGVVHDDLKWHHIGLLPGTIYERAIDGSMTVNNEISVTDLNEIFLLDLDAVKTVENLEERNKWVRESYAYLESRA